MQSARDTVCLFRTPMPSWVEKDNFFRKSSVCILLIMQPIYKIFLFGLTSSYH